MIALGKGAGRETRDAQRCSPGCPALVDTVAVVGSVGRLDMRGIEAETRGGRISHEGAGGRVNPASGRCEFRATTRFSYTSCATLGLGLSAFKRGLRQFPW